MYCMLDYCLYHVCSMSSASRFRQAHMVHNTYVRTYYMHAHMADPLYCREGLRAQQYPTCNEHNECPIVHMHARRYTAVYTAAGSTQSVLTRHHAGMHVPLCNSGLVRAMPRCRQCRRHFECMLYELKRREIKMLFAVRRALLGVCVYRRLTADDVSTAVRIRLFARRVVRLIQTALPVACMCWPKSRATQLAYAAHRQRRSQDR